MDTFKNRLSYSQFQKINSYRLSSLDCNETEIILTKELLNFVASGVLFVNDCQSLFTDDSCDNPSVVVKYADKSKKLILEYDYETHFPTVKLEESLFCCNRYRYKMTNRINLSTDDASEILRTLSEMVQH